jgi:hypothetical protein
VNKSATEEVAKREKISSASILIVNSTKGTTMGLAMLRPFLNKGSLAGKKK